MGNIDIWHRSMGTATALLYTYKNPRIKVICLDSPFADFRKLVKELASNNFNYTNFLWLQYSIFWGKNKEKKWIRYKFIKAYRCSKKTFKPGMFIHAKNDKLIGVEHTLDIYEQYPGVKCVYLLEKGGHN